MFTVIRMSAATVSALALIALMVFFIVESRPQKKTLSMLDLAEFRDLPGELRAMVKSAMPNGAQLKKHWAHMTPEQKQMVMQQISAQMPQKPQQDNRPPAPSMVVKPDAPKEEPTPPPLGLKPGFLLSDSVNKSKKKNTKDKKHDKVITFSDIGASEDEEPVVSTDITDVDA